MASESPPTGPAEVGAAPFIGLRPFAREERHLLFGRARDTQILLDKALSARLTVLYAQSGHGKSSLLRALVIPELEAEESIVLYFDAWTQEDPLGSLKQELADLAGRLGVTDAGAGGPTLVDLVRLIAAVDGRSVVLVLDQFEEFLVTHGRSLDPVRKELAALARARGLDTHVVLSLREEFLAALEPFRQDILDLFQSTYRLESLPTDGLREAIQRPVETFDGTCETALVEALTQDLEVEEATERADETVGAAVELPMLQLVCSRLWEAAQRSGSRDLTLALYERLGRTDRILNEYVRDVMPRRWRDQKLTARLMQLLAPPSGLKMSYSAEDLTKTTELPAARVRTELDRLEKARILRTREYRAGTRYELQHDAFVKVVSPWRDAVLHKARRRRVAAGVLGAGALAAMVTAGIWIPLYFQQQESARREQVLAQATVARAQAEARRFEELDQWRSGGAFEEIRSLSEPERLRRAPGVFDMVVSYLLLQKTGPDDLSRLRDVLMKNEDLIPPGYGIRAPRSDPTSAPKKSWPLSLEYSEARDMDPDMFRFDWDNMARSLAMDWGIPVPKRIRLEPRPNFTKGYLRLTHGRKPETAYSVSWTAPIYDRRPILTEVGLSEPSRAFLDHLKTLDVPREVQDRDLEEVKGLSHGGPWRAVPRWSLPAWRVSGDEATAGSGITAVMVANQLLAEPRPLFPPAVVDLLLKRVESVHPSLVSEVRCARGDRLGQDFTEIVQLGWPMTGIQQMLDSLASYPELQDSAQVAKQVVEDIVSARVWVPEHLHGAWSGDGDSSAGVGLDDAADPQDATAPYREVEPWLADLEPEIRVCAGSEIQARWFDGYELAPGLELQIDALREFMYRDHGITFPGIRFRPHTWYDGLDSEAFQIEVLDQTREQEDTQPIPVAPDRSLDVFAHQMKRRLAALRVYWITADLVNRHLSTLGDQLEAWTRERYSVTDVKALLRGVVEPTDEELDAWYEAKEQESVAVDPGRSMRHTAWLLGSLVFWCQIEDPLDARALISRLRQTQRARTRALSETVVSEETLGDITMGSAALAEDRIDDALSSFRAATVRDPEGASRAFLAEWPRRLVAQQKRRFDERTGSLESITLDQSERLDLEELLAGLDPTGDAPRIRRYELCVFLGASDLTAERRLELLRSFLEGALEPDAWPVDEARIVALEALKLYDPFRDAPLLVDRASALIRSVVRRQHDPEAHATYRAVTEIAYDRDAANWCWRLLRELATLKPDGVDPSIPLELAFALSSHEKQAALLEAIATFDKEEVKTRRAQISEDRRRELLDSIRYGRALAQARLVNFGHGEHLEASETTLRDLLRTDQTYLHESASDALGQLLLDEDRLADSIAVVKPALLKWPQSAGFHNLWLLLMLQLDDTEAAARTAAGVVEAVGESNTGAWFVAALGQILTRQPGWEDTARRFLSMDHPYTNYIAMLLYANADTEGREDAWDLLQRRWAEIMPRRGQWEARLRQGDAMVWREMLIGYYVGEIEWQEVVGDLEDEARYTESPLADLTLSRRGMLCEAYFYDAVLARARGDEDRMRAQLEQTIATRYVSYIEYKLAKYLIRTMR